MCAPHLRRFLLASAAVTLLPIAARAQPAITEAPSPVRGVVIPEATVAGDADATSVETNPGQLGLVESASTALVFDQWDGDTHRQGRGLSLLFAGPLIVRGYTLGAGLQWLRPTIPGEPNNYFKLQLGAGLRLGAGLGFGAVWEHLLTGRYDGLDTVSLGLGWRMHSRLALGLAVHDLTRPRPVPGAPRLPREWDVEMAIRPLATDRLELAVGVRALEGSKGSRPLLPHARLHGGVLPGLALFAEFATPRERVAYFNAAGVREEGTDYLALFGLTVSFDRLSLTGAGFSGWRTGVPGDGGARGPGGSFVLRTSANRRPALIALPYIARVKLAGLENDRSFLETIMRLRRLADDPGVAAVLLHIDGLDLGYGRIDELRAVLASLGARKPVFAWLSHPSTKEYYLASVCQRLALHPAGGVMLTGLGQTILFFKGALDALGVKVELVRIAEYKGAMEPFILPESSGPVRDNRNAMLDDVFGRVLAELARARAGAGLTAPKLRAAIDRGLFTPTAAKEAGLVDEIADDGQVDDFVRRTLGRGLPVRDADYGWRETGRWRAPRVAIIMVDGAITDGKPAGFPPFQGTVAWADPIVEALQAVRGDPSVGAVVLRVNSPGGSAFASDRIAREVRRVVEARKPVIVSMGDTAASGGYYIAAPGDVVYAAPSTITGSIGIYGFKVDGGGLIGKLGITTETTKRGPRADFFSPYRAWSDDERAAMMAQLEYSYRQFLHTVAEGRQSRGMTEARANELGRGRIWTGSQGTGIGLVDRLAGVDAAVDEAARRAGVPTGAGGLPEMVLLPAAPNDPLETLLALRRLARADEDSPTDRGALNVGDAAAAILLRQGKAAARLLLPLLFGPSDGAGSVQARLPYEIELR